MKIGILGVGKLGLCFALNLERAGHHVLGIDISETYVKQLNDKTFSSYEPQVNPLLQQSTNFKASTHIADVLTDTYDLLFIMVATPSVPGGGYDHHQIERIAGALINFGRREKTVHLVIGCTVMPGYCDELQKQLAEYNYLVSYNPEFIAQGNIIEDQLYPDQILIGEANKQAGDMLEAVYKTLCKSSPVVCRMSRISAEIAKLATNCFLTTKISFANSIGDLATKAGAEPDKILAAIGADQRIGTKYLRYGYGFGGPCFPRDNRALNAYATSHNYEMLIGKATDEVNRQHLKFQLEDLLARHSSNEVIVFNEVSYKPGTVIIEEAQQLELAIGVAKAGRKVLIREKQAVIEQLRSIHGALFMYEVLS